MDFRELGNIMEMSKMVPCLPFKIKTFVIKIQSYTEAVTKVFYFCPILLEFFTLFQMFLSRIVEISAVAYE